MKRLLLLAGPAALCALALFAVYCATLTDDNELDENGSKKHWAWDITDDECKDWPGPDGKPLGDGCKDYILNNVKNTDVVSDSLISVWEDKKNCKNTPLTINFVYNTNTPKTVELNTGNEDGFKRFMGSPNYNGIIEYTTGAEVTVVLKNSGGAEISKDNMPPTGDNYTITYTIKKLKCGTDDEYMEPPSPLVITLNIKEVGADPNINAPSARSITVKNDGTAEAFNVSDGVSVSHGCVASNTSAQQCTDPKAAFSITVKKGNDTKQIPFTVKNTDVGEYVITYTLNVQGYAPVTKTTTVTVVLENTTNEDPPAVIVFNKYQYTVNIGGTDRTVTSPDTAFLGGSTFREPGIGALAAYYVKDGQRHTIDVTLGGNLRITQNTIPSSTPSRPSTSGYNVTYTLDAGTGHKGGTATRKVYLTTTHWCEGTPVMTFAPTQGNAALNVSLSSVPWWNPSTSTGLISSSFSVSAVDGSEDGQEARAYKLGIYSTPDLRLDELTPPAVQAYTITYVGVTECATGSGNRLRLHAHTATRALNVTQ